MSGSALPAPVDSKIKESQAKTKGPVYRTCARAKLNNGRAFCIDYPRLCILHRDRLYDGVMHQTRVTRLVQICDTTYRLRPIDIVLFIVSRDKYCRNIST